MENKELVPSYLRQPYPITMARHSFNVYEMRIMFRVTQALQKHMEYEKNRAQVQTTLLGDKIISLPVKTLLPEGSEHYTEVKKAIKNLEKEPIVIRDRSEKGECEISTRLIMRSEYNFKSEVVELQIDRVLLASYLALAKTYSRFSLDVAFNSSSTYVMKLYQFVSHWKDKSPVITVRMEELREWLQLSDKYERSHDLKYCILEPTAKELKERADVWFDIEEPIKEGKRIVGWKFRIFQKGATTKEDKTTNIDHTQTIFRNLKGFCRLSPDQMQELQPILSRLELHEHIHEKLVDISNQWRKGKIKNLPIYTMSVLKNEFADLLAPKGQKTS